jgi:hypothetical protein
MKKLIANIVFSWQVFAATYPVFAVLDMALVIAAVVVIGMIIL